MAFQPPIAFAHSPLLPSFLDASRLPPVLTVLQAHSRLKNVQTLTTALQPVVHPAFGLRFVRLEEGSVRVEEGREEKGKWVDWVGQRVGEVRVEEGEGEEGAWLEGQRCLEACAGLEGCVALLLIASTLDPSPVSALQQLYNTTKPFSDARALLVFYLVITTSPADPTLLPSLQRTFGPHTAVLSLPEPSPADTQITVPPPLPIPPLLHTGPPPSTPALVRPSLDTTTTSSSEPLTPIPLDRTPDSNTDKPLPTPSDISQALTGPSGSPVTTIPSSVSQAWHRFLREFVTQSLVPYMERTVLSLHESYTSRRALPSRLLSITSRRFFSSAPSSPTSTPRPGGSASVSTTSLVGTPSGDRRLVEWSAMLGDVKEVAAVGDGVRREGKANVEDVLLLHTLYYPPPPPPASQAVPSLTPLAVACLKPPHPSTAASLLVRALVLARADYLLISRSREGMAGMGYDKRAEVARWFVLAAGSAEEPLAALLLGRAAVWEPARRRKGMWYALAGGRMERCGLKPLALLYLRRSYQLYSTPPTLLLSQLASVDPSLLELPAPPSSAPSSPTKKTAFPIPPSIPRSLGRLLYTTHETHGAVRVFLDLLGQRCVMAEGEMWGDEEREDEVLLEDFRLSYQTLLDSGNMPPGLSLPSAQTFLVRSSIETRLPLTAPSPLLATWETFSRSLGPTDRGSPTRADVGREVVVEVVLRNPFRCEVMLGEVTVVAQGKEGDVGAEGVEVGRLEEVRLAAGEETIISIPIQASKPTSLTLPSLTFSFLSLLPTTLSLTSTPRPRRLNDTPAQQRDPTYAPPAPLAVSFEEPRPVLEVELVLDGDGGEVLVLGAGEWRAGKVKVRNTGVDSVGEVWVVLPEVGSVWVDTTGKGLSGPEDSVSHERLATPNTLLPPSPLLLPIASLHPSGSPTLAPGETLSIPFILHGQLEGPHTLSLLLAFRSASTGPFYLASTTKPYEVERLLEVSATVRPERGEERGYEVLLEVENLRSVEAVRVEQVVFLNSNWRAEVESGDSSLFSPVELEVVKSGTLRLRRAEDTDQEAAQAALKFLSEKLNAVLVGSELEKTLPADVPLALSYLTPDGKGHSFSSAPYIPYLVSSSVRTSVTSILSRTFPLIPTNTFPYIFPLYTPRTAWLALFFSLPTSGRRGCVIVGGLTLEAGSKLVEVPLEEGEETKKKVRSMYAETAREKEELVGAVRASGWAREEDPVVVDVKVEEGEEVAHDFATGPPRPCSLHITFTFRNFSPSRLARFTLRLPSPIRGPSLSPPLLPPPYTGVLVHKGSVGPMGVATKKARMAVSRTGMYALGGWRLDVEVGEGEVSRFVQVGREGSVSVVQAGRGGEGDSLGLEQ